MTSSLSYNDDLSCSQQSFIKATLPSFQPRLHIDQEQKTSIALQKPTIKLIYVHSCMHTAKCLDLAAVKMIPFSIQEPFLWHN